MKKSIVVSAMYCLFTVSTAIADSTVDSAIKNSTTAQQLIDMAVGRQSEANFGVVKMK